VAKSYSFGTHVTPVTPDAWHEVCTWTNPAAPGALSLYEKAFWDGMGSGASLSLTALTLARSAIIANDFIFQQ